MKQNITEQDFLNLSKKGQSNYIVKWGLDKLITIGEMIEFLHTYEPDKDVLNIYRNESYLKMENRISWETDDGVLTTKGAKSGWAVKHFFPNPWYEVDTKVEENELCDALWQAVKQVLEEHE